MESQGAHTPPQLERTVEQRHSPGTWGHHCLSGFWIFLDPLSMARPSHMATCVTPAGPLEVWGGAIYFDIV